MANDASSVQRYEALLKAAVPLKGPGPLVPIPKDRPNQRQKAMTKGAEKEVRPAQALRP